MPEGVPAVSGAQGGSPPPAPDKPGVAVTGAGRSRRVLLPLGDLARSVLADGLRAAGWDVHAVVAYRTVPLALPDDVVDAAWGGTIDLGVVAAGSAARELARQLGEAAPPVVAIGQPSAEAAVAAGLTVVGVAERPTDDALAAALVAAAGGTVHGAAVLDTGDLGAADLDTAVHGAAVHGAAPTTGPASTHTAPTTRSDT
nr:uroporphyrinogen-III synthase [Xylanimonas cellulosilytica]